MTADWAHLRGVFALEGVNWRSWSAADRVSAGYIMLKRSLTGNDLRELYELVGDTESLAVLDRQAMGQTGGVELSQFGVR